MSKKFRKAGLDDLGEICDLVAGCWAKHGSSYGVEMDVPSMVSTVRMVIEKGVCLVGDGATAGGTVLPFLWNRHVYIGNIVFWSFSKPKGALIFDSIAEEFKKSGATHISCASHFPDNRSGDFYLKKGLQRSEIQYLGSLKSVVR